MENYDELSINLNRLCKFACGHSNCPPEVCQITMSSPDGHLIERRKEEGKDNHLPGVVTVPENFDEDSVKNQDKNDK